MAHHVVYETVPREVRFAIGAAFSLLAATVALCVWAWFAKDQALPWLYVVGALWAAGPPLWFWYEYHYLFKTLAPDTQGSLDAFKHGQQLSVAIWAGVLAFLYAYASSNHFKQPATNDSVQVQTVAVQNAPPAATDGFSLSSVLATFIGGGFVGSMLTLYFNWKKAKQDLGMSLISQYVEKHNDIANALHVLTEPRTPGDGEKVNSLLSVGNWMEMVSKCFLSRLADPHLLVSMSIPRALATVYRQFEATPSWLTPEQMSNWPSWRRVADGDTPPFLVDSGVSRPPSTQAAQA